MRTLDVSTAVVSISCLLLAASARAEPPERGQLPRTAVVAPTAASAQAPGGMLPDSDPFMLLANSVQVQADLGLTEDQIRRLGDTGQLFRSQLAELAQGSDPATVAERKRQEWTSRGAIARLLTPAQLERLQALMLQIHGPCIAANDDAFAHDLDLSGKQLAEVREACARLAEDIAATLALPPSAASLCAAAMAERERIDGLRAAGRKQVLALLSEEQRKVLIRMQGRKLTLAPTEPAECNIRH